MADGLKVYQDGQGSNLMEWIQEKGERIYTNVGKQTWRVPPLKFNSQIMSEEKLNKKENGVENIRIEGKVLGQPKVTDQETNRAEGFVCGAFEKLSNSIIERRIGSAMFLISNFEYDNYLNKLSHFVTETRTDVPCNQTNNVNVEPLNLKETLVAGQSKVKLPKDVARRGELDILILHQEAGVVLVQTKAVGYNFFNNSPQFERSKSVQTAVEKAGDQLSRDRRVMMYIMEDLQLKDDQITSVVALPNLPRKVLMEEMSSELKNKVYSEFNLDLVTNFLCEEDLQLDNGFPGALEKWWEKVLLPRAKGMSLQIMQQIAYRTVGLMSTVSVWSYAQPRIEVRNWNEAAWETGNRYTQVVLSPKQVEILKREDQYLYVWGPAGSGKTLLLSLKGRQWLRRDCNVAIINTRLGSRGRTVGQVIETTINKTEDLKKKAIRIDLDLMDNEETLSSILCEHVKGEIYNFLLDEIAWVKETEKLLVLLKKYYPYSAIWCAGMLIECQPEGFTSEERLKVILRCPPSVQRVLRIVDSRDERCQLYKLESATAGLPTDGLPPFFIIHSKHGDPSIQPYDCPICARELSDFLIEHLNMKNGVINRQPANQADQDSGSCKSDIIATGQFPWDENISEQKSSSRESDSGCDLEYHCKDTFEDPLQLEKENNPSLSRIDRNGNISGTKNGKKGPIHVFEQGAVSNMSVSTGCVPNSKVKNFNTRKMNQDKTETNNCPKKTKSQTKKSGKNSKSTQVNDCEESVVTKSDSGRCSRNQNYKSTECENKSTSNFDQENNENNQNSTPSPGCHNSKKTRKVKHKHKSNPENLNDGANYPRLKFSDAVLPVTVPRMWHHYNKRGYWSISREALAQEMILLGSRDFCQALYYSGVPLKVEEAMVMNAEGKELENHFVMCPVGAVHGLEYKLVVCVPSACALPEYIEISQGIRHGQMEPKHLMKRTQFAADYLKCTDKMVHDSYFSDTNGAIVPKIDKVRISTHVAEEGAPYDMLYEPLPVGEIGLVSMENQIRSEAAASPIPYVAPTYTDSEIQKFKEELCGQCSDRDKCVCRHFNTDELAALHRLDAWNRAYVLMCASRCTSTLVLVLP